MELFKFDETDGLRNTVTKYQPFCTLSPSKEITELKEITSDICGHKFSKLCGFTFISALPSQYRKFSIVYCPKTRGTHSRNDRGLSGWYCWKHIGPGDEIVLSKTDMLNVYGFDLDKFFQSDVFEKYAAMMKKQCSKAMSTVVEKFVASLKNPTQKKEAIFYTNCVNDSIGRMLNVKLAYNADNTYNLKLSQAASKSIEHDNNQDNQVQVTPVQEAVNDYDEEYITLRDMIAAQRAKYPHNSEGGFESEILIVVEGKQALASNVVFVKPSTPTTGTFIISDNSSASKATVEKLVNDMDVDFSK